MEFRLADPDLSKLAPGTREVELVAIEEERLTFRLCDPKMNEQAKYWRNAIAPIRGVVEEMTEAMNGMGATPAEIREWVFKLNTVCP